MLTIPYIRDNRDTILNGLKIKNFKSPELIDQIIEVDNERRSLQAETNELQAEMNRLSKEIGELFKSGAGEEANQVKEQTSAIKQKLDALEQNLQKTTRQVNDLLLQVPNIPHSSVPAGKSDADNKEIRRGGTIPKLPEGSIPHWELAKKYKLIDFELGVKITGAGFPVFRGQGARLQRALISWFLDKNTAAGYEEILPPLMVNEASGFGTGQLPDKEGQMYHVTGDNLYLIPTAEVPVTNLYRDVILNAEDLPVKNTAYTPCFRREAGSYGKDVRGLNRLHQFDKVEIVRIEHPARSYQALDEMVSHVEQLIIELGLPYRIIELCGGDLSFTSALTFDFEVFSAAQEKWLEVSSVSNFESYQANRLKLRFKEPGEKKTMLAHTLNGSSLALPRIMAALLENYQTPEGILIPEVLHAYLAPENRMIT